MVLNDSVAQQHVSKPAWSVKLKFFPHPSLTTESVAGRVAPVFILASLMFNFVVILMSLVRQREGNGQTSHVEYLFAFVKC